MSTIVEYETDTGKIKLSGDTIRRYLVSGQGNVTDQEVVMFMALCKYQRLNPFLREAYLIKYDNSPATIVTGKDMFTKRAASNQNCGGWEAGVIVQEIEKGSVEYRKGTLILDGEKLVGGWAKVLRKDWTTPMEITVSLNEYLRRRSKDGKPTRSWEEMPATMIRKVALVQALREAFPAEFAGLYSPEEMPVEPSELSTQPVGKALTGPEEPGEPEKEETVQPVNPPESSNSKIQFRSPDAPATDGQIKKMFATARERGVENETLKQLIKDRTGKESSKDLTMLEISEVIEDLKVL